MFPPQNKEILGLAILNREIKILWMQGALSKPGGDDAQAADIAQKMQHVGELYGQVQKMVAKKGVADVRAGPEPAAGDSTTWYDQDDDEDEDEDDDPALALPVVGTHGGFGFNG